MKPISYNFSYRVAKARFSAKAKFARNKYIRFIGYLLVAIGLVAIFIQDLVYLSPLLGLGIIIVMFDVWFKWDISNNEAIMNTDLAQIQLDQVVTSDIVYLVNDKQNPREVLLAISGNWQVSFIVLRYGLDIKYLMSTLSGDPRDSAQLWNNAYLLAQKVPIREISAGVLFVAMILNNKPMLDWLATQGMDEDDIMGGLMWEESLWRRIIKPRIKNVYGGIGRDWASGYTAVLDQFGLNISLGIIEGGLDYSEIGRENIIMQMMTNLNKANNGNIAVVGEVGVGKTELVYALAHRLMLGKDVPEELKYKQIIQIDPGVVTASANQGMSLELIINQILTNAAKAGNIILYFDEAQLFFGKEGGAVDISGMILPALQSSRIKIITSFSIDDWHKVSTANPSLTGNLFRVDVDATDQDETIDILQDISIALEARSKTVITYKALQSSYSLAERYIRNKAMPARAIDLLSDSTNYPVNGFITQESVERATEIIANTKVAKADETEKSQLLNLESLIHERMINQERAVKVVSNALRRARAGVRSPNRPVGSFLFLGPTGVGKTELTKALSSVYFGGESEINRLDMSEYQNKKDVDRLLASANLEESGSSFLQKVNQNPFSVILFDEIEKAHPDILNLLLQLLDEGTLTDTAGHKINFKEAIIICTSNAGADDIRSEIEKGRKLEEFESEFIDRLIDRKIFKPELMNRFDEIVLFRPLNKEELYKVAELILSGVNKQLSDRKVSVSLTPEAINFLVDNSYDPRLGARPMRRAISRSVENLVAQKLLNGEVKPGSKVDLDVADLTSVV